MPGSILLGVCIWAVVSLLIINCINYVSDLQNRIEELEKKAGYTIKRGRE